MLTAEIIPVIDWLQFIGAVSGISGSWCVAAISLVTRFRGYLLYVISNIAFIAWAVIHGAPWLLLMNLCFAITTTRGLWINRPRKLLVGRGNI